MISVIIPVYNATTTVVNTVQSVLNQTYCNIEIILINDGSLDDSLKKCKMLEQNNPCIKVMNQNNQGASVARNRGIDEASGEWIMFIDADDILPPMAMELLLKNITSNVDIIVGCHYEGIPENNSSGIQEIDSSFFVKAALFPEKHAAILQKSLGKSQEHREVCIGAPWGKLFKRSFLIKNKIRFPEGIVHHEDTLFCLKAFLNTKRVKLINADVYCYVRSENSVTKRFNPNRIADMLFVIQKTLEEVGRIDEEFDEAIEHFVFSRCIDCIKGNITHIENQYTYAENIQQMKAFLRDSKIIYFFKHSRVSRILLEPYLFGMEKVLLLLEKYRQAQIIVIVGRFFSYIKRIRNE